MLSDSGLTSDTWCTFNLISPNNVFHCFHNFKSLPQKEHSCDCGSCNQKIRRRKHLSLVFAEEKVSVTETNTEGYSSRSRWLSQGITEGQSTSGKLCDLLDSGLGTLEITLLLTILLLCFLVGFLWKMFTRKRIILLQERKVSWIHPCNSNMAILLGLHCQMTAAWKGLYKQRRSTYIQ